MVRREGACGTAADNLLTGWEASHVKGARSGHAYSHCAPYRLRSAPHDSSLAAWGSRGVVVLRGILRLVSGSFGTPRRPSVARNAGPL
jgi:hypothetical protein